jgi:hypothetical protein
MKITSILITLSICSVSASAQVWQHTYGYNGSVEISKAIKNTYDSGFFIGIDKNNNSIFIIKSNINGEILWQKYIKSNSPDYLILSHINTNNLGAILLTGGYYSGSKVNSYVIALDSCLNYQSCHTININDGNYGKFVFYIKNRSDVLLMTYAAGIWPVERNQLWKIQSNGTIEWMKQILSLSETYYDGTEFQQMCLTSDGGSLMAGYTYYPYDTTNNPYDAVLQPCLVKCDSLGDMQWVYPPLSGADTTKIGFFAGCAQIGNTYYAVGSHYQLDSQYFLRPLVARFDLNGNLQSYICSEPDTMYHSLSQVLPVSDTSILLISAANNIFTDPNYLMVFLSDTMGHFTKAFTRTDLVVGQYGDEVAKMRDNKFVIPCQYPIGWPGANTDVVAIKLNANLEYDSIYTQTFIYDSLCPYPIVSDTVICNCEPFVSVKEAESVNEILSIHPNPASTYFTVEYGQAQADKCFLLVYDVYGRLKYRVVVPAGINISRISCAGWEPGLYLVRSQSGGKIMSGKVLVK